MTGKPCDGFEPTGASTGESGASVLVWITHDPGLTGPLLTEPSPLFTSPRARAGVPLQTNSPNQAVAIPPIPLQWAVLRASRPLKAIPPTRIGVDTGGTFTDCVVLDGSEVRILKVFSTPDDSARGITEGVRLLTAAKPGAERAIEIIHGTTVGTNTLLERRGARVALVTTEGFEDLIEIGRQARPRLYDLNVQREPPVVPRALRFGVKERTAADGRIVLRP